jgi:hypothetical protein
MMMMTMMMMILLLLLRDALSIIAFTSTFARLAHGIIFIIITLTPYTHHNTPPPTPPSPPLQC